MARRRSPRVSCSASRPSAGEPLTVAASAARSISISPARSIGRPRRQPPSSRPMPRPPRRSAATTAQRHADRNAAPRPLCDLCGIHPAADRIAAARRTARASAIWARRSMKCLREFVSRHPRARFPRTPRTSLSLMLREAFREQLADPGFRRLRLATHRRRRRLLSRFRGAPPRSNRKHRGRDRRQARDPASRRLDLHCSPPRPTGSNIIADGRVRSSITRPARRPALMRCASASRRN